MTTNAVFARRSSSQDTLGDLVAAAALRDPAGMAAADLGGQGLTWADLDTRSNQAARGLLSAGLRKGDRVITVVGERLEYVELYAALAKAGLVAVPVSWRFRPRELAIIALDAEPAAIVYEDTFADTVDGALDDLPMRPALFELGPGSLDSARPWSTLAADQRAAPIDEAVGSDLAILGYTSGTTGLPKGAAYDHQTCRLAAGVAALSYGMPQFGVGVLTGSLSYATVTIVHLWSHILTNGTSIIAGRFDAGHVVELLERHGGTFTYLPTPTIQSVSDLLAATPVALERLRVVVVGASPIPRHVLANLVDVAGDRVVQSYGMTESAGAPVCIGRRADWIAESEPYTCVGRVTAPAVIVLEGEAGKLPNDGQTVGELIVRSPTVMREYWRNEPATADALLDGWFRTGDLGTISPDGHVVLKGRAKEVIISGGANIFPVEVETVIAESNRIRECAIVGAPHDRWGETPVAFVVVDGARDGVEEHVRQLCREALAAYKCPTRVVVIDQLPRNANNKILKRELAERAASHDTPGASTT